MPYHLIQLVSEHLRSLGIGLTVAPHPYRWIHIHQGDDTRGYIDFTEDCIQLRPNAITINNGYGHTVTIDPDTNINYADPELLDKIAQWSRLDKTVNYVNVSALACLTSFNAACQRSTTTTQNKHNG